MKEVKQAWTSLLSSRNSLMSGTVIGTANSNVTGNNSCAPSVNRNNCNSRATWYDAPIPVIIHGREFHEDDTDKPGKPTADTSPISDKSSAGKTKKSMESIIVPRDTMSKRKMSKDSGIETIASLRRSFLDDVISDKADLRLEEDSRKRIVTESTTITVVSDVNSSRSTNATRKDDSMVSGLDNGEVLYQNNVEAALNSLSKVCAKELDISVDSSRNPTGHDDSLIKREDGKLTDEDNDNDEDKNGSIGIERRGRRRRKSSSGSRRLSSSVELTAMTTIKTDDAGVPTISFSFLRNEENSKPYIRDIPLNDGDDPNTESPNHLVEDQLYDFPKSGADKRSPEVNKVDSTKETLRRTSGDLEKGHEGLKVQLPEKRLLGDGEVGPAMIMSEDLCYDFPKRRNPNVECSKTDDVLPRLSVSGCSIDIEMDNEERLYESPMDSKELASSSWKESVPDDSTLLNDPDSRAKVDGPKGSRLPRDQNKRNYRSLRSGRSIGRIEIMEEDQSKTLQAYYSDPECQESSGNVDDTESDDGRKVRKRNRRLGKAWGKMRSWLREEKSRFGEVVTRHAKMQAVGANRDVKHEHAPSSLGNRTGSYDLVEARTMDEVGSITRVEEFGLSSVSEEGNASGSERPGWTSYELRLDHEDELLSDVDQNADDDDKKYGGKNQRADSSPNVSSDAEFTSGRTKRTLSTDNIKRGIGMKLTPVSFSVDKLCNDGVNDDGMNGTADRRDSEQTTATMMTTTTTSRDHVGKGGLIKRRMLGSIRGLMASTHLLQQHESEEGGPGGFEDVRRYVKQGGDFCKELAAILHERAELEASYSKGLSKLSGKLTKACTKDQGGNGSGGVTEAWRSIGEEMEAAAEAHRAWGVALSEQLAKPLRVGVAEAQGRSRKVIESSVDKASKSLQEWRGIAAKSKKQSFACARENERLQDLARIQSISQSQQNNNKTSSSHHMTEKEVNKLETRRRKAEDSSRRADTEFYTVSVRAERARLEYESTVRKGAKQMELLEEERLSALKDLANVYLAHLQALAPRLQQSADRLSSPVRNCSVSQDVDILKNVIRRLDSNDGSNVDQLLPDFYAEHVTLAMNRERRKQSLVRVLHLIRQDLERERRGREGLETLHRAFIQTPAFAADESTQNVTEKLHHMRSMLTFLEAARYKVGGTLAEVEGGKRGKHPLAEHILVSRDKQGLQQSVLKVPSWAKNESFELPEVQDELDIHLDKTRHESERRDWVDRTAGDGNSENPPDEEDFSDFDEFSSQSEDNNNQEVEIVDISDSKVDSIGEQCRAIYQYSANLNDELSLTPGDLITIHAKQADGWWIGECSGRTGIFPATYVQLIH